MAKLIAILNSFLITNLCFLCIYILHEMLFPLTSDLYVIAAFGASAVLVFSTSDNGGYSMKNTFFGASIGAVIGVFFNMLDLDKALSIILAISTCIFMMNLTNLKYPPGGAIALIPVLSGNEIERLGYYYLYCPVLTGITIIFLFSKLQILINTKLYKQWQVPKQ